jgi:tetratricopeptide (TPR) repeat protein
MRLGRWIAAGTAAAAALLGAPRAASAQELRLPAWIDPGVQRVTPATHQAGEDPLTPHRRPAELPPAAQAAQPMPSAITGADAAVRQLELAATDATTRHALNRLIARYEALRPGLDNSDHARRADAVAAWALVTRSTTAPADADRALADLQRAVQLDPESQSAWLTLSAELTARGELEAARQAIDDLLAHHPHSAAAWGRRAALRLRSGDADDALADCNRALALLPAEDPQHAETLALRGAAHHAAGRLKEAGADFDASLALAPRHPAALAGRGHVYAEAGYYDQAIADYLASLHQDPWAGETYRALAWVLATCPDPALRDSSTAQEAAERALRLLGEASYLTLDAAAAASASTGDFAEAIRLQQKALLAAPNGRATPALRRRLELYESGRPYVAQTPRLTR